MHEIFGDRLIATVDEVLFSLQESLSVSMLTSLRREAARDVALRLVERLPSAMDYDFCLSLVWLLVGHLANLFYVYSVLHIAL